MPNLMDYSPRNTFQDTLAAILQGGMQGFSAGQKSLLDAKKEMWKEKLRREITPLQQSQINYNNARTENVGRSSFDNISPGVDTTEPQVDNTQPTKPNLPEGYEIGYNSKGQKILTKKKQSKPVSEKEILNNDLRDVITAIENGGDINTIFRELQRKYPKEDFGPFSNTKLSFNQYIPKEKKPIKQGRSFLSGAKLWAGATGDMLNPATAVQQYGKAIKGLFNKKSTQSSTTTNYPTATNPNTGEKIGLINGQWQSIPK